ncbi:DUF3971 domain-containing protein [Falsirhodobacter halotolerans]|uniref:YhdP family protein n=1 Tax=Falsirhodobacter halotolerans TaxID=1146892 RepID=UPI001FD530F6|nr:DUF3971 domain-containing protein [Falsirhodobacter halotolerans]MCJ8140212.1 hypothetical protein [Falsirhodobacter halotolerans]
MKQDRGTGVAGKRAAGRLMRGAGAMCLVALTLVVLAIGALAVSGRAVPLPRAVLDVAQHRIDAGLRQAGTTGVAVRLGGVSLAVERSLRPRVVLRDIRVSDATQRPILHLPEARLVFTHPTLLTPVPRPYAVVLDGARIAVRRDADGRFDLALGVQAEGAMTTDYAGALEEVRRFLTAPVISDLHEISISRVTVRIDDERADRIWELRDGSLTLLRDDDILSADLSAGVAGTTEGRLGLSIAADLENGQTTLRADVRDVATTDVAAQAAPLAVLAVLRAPAAGTVRASLDRTGALAAFDARLELGRGALLPRDDMRPIPFDSAGLTIGYDPTDQRLDLADLSVQGPTLRTKAVGQMFLRDLERGRPQTLLAQIRLRDVAVDPQGLFTEPVRFSEGQLDARLRLDPFTLDIGQVALMEGERTLRGRGQVRADPDGWWLSFDPTLNAIRRDQLLALWPVTLVPRTRDWLDQNVLEGNLRDVRAAVRIAPGQETRVALGYSFAGGDVRFLRTLPPIEGGEGYSAIQNDRYSMVLERGHVTPPEGGRVAADRSTLVVPDLRERPIRAQIDLVTRSSVTAALSLLDQPPFRFLSRANRSVDLGTGQAAVRTRLTLPIVDGLTPDAVDFDVQGRITDFASSTLVPGKELLSDALTLAATPQALTVAGDGTLAGVPFTATYRLPLAAPGTTQTVVGQATLSPRAARTFGIDLPDGLITGQGQGRFQVALDPGQPPHLTLTSDLRGIGAAVPAVGWSKPAAAAGRLEVDAVLSEPTEVRRLAVEGGGLAAEGRVDLTPAGGLDAVRFSRLRLNGWLDAPVTLTARGAGQTPAVAVGAGMVDLRRLSLGPGGGDGAGDTPVTARLDEVRVSDALALTDMRGDFRTAGGFQGDFAGRINGGTEATGRLTPSEHGTAIRLYARDAGGALRSAGIFDKATGGPMEVILTPRAASGEYDGVARANALRIHDLPVLAQAVNAVSVVGAAQAAEGGGILFDGAEARFRFTPGAVEVTQGVAVGASLGVTAAGVYRMADKRFFMQGVVSPIYFLNGALAPRGEGLFGVTYRLRGTADAPKFSANPLALLAPGPLRDLLQSPPPRLAE